MPPAALGNLGHFALGRTWRALSGEVHQTRGMWGKDCKVILWQSRMGRLCLHLTEVTNAHCSPASSPAFLSSVIPKSWQRIWATPGPWENQPVHTHKHVLSVLCQSASISLAPSLTHTYAHYHTHTTLFSPNTHGGERLVAGNVKLLCHVQSQSGSLTTVCVDVCMFCKNPQSQG